MEVLPGVFRVAMFGISVTDWFNMQPCLVKEGYRYQVKKSDETMLTITVLKVTEIDQTTKEMLNDYI